VDTALEELASVSKSRLNAQVEHITRTLHERYPANSQNLEKFDVPSAVGTGIHVEGDQLSFLHFGDCALIVLDNQDSEIYVSAPSALQGLDLQVIEKLSKLRSDEGLSFAEARAKVLPLLRENRARGNTSNGYGNISVFGESPHPSTTNALGVRPGTTGLIASDGFYALVDDYHAYNPVELVSAARTKGLRILLDELREVESRDKECVEFPRLKPHDDASALLFEIR
jgi:hypothetical protein